MIRISACLLAIFLTTHSVTAQDRPEQPAGFTIMDDAAVTVLLQRSQQTLPKFYAALTDARAHDPLIQRVVFGHASGQGRGPAFANPNGNIRIDASFLETLRPNFDDNRLVVVLEHEIGHLHYYLKTPPGERTSDRSEQAAFEYSLQQTKAMAQRGDCAPLQSGIRFMLLRSQSDNLSDAHVRALKRIVTEPLYADYVQWIQTHCAAGAKTPPAAQESPSTTN